MKGFKVEHETFLYFIMLTAGCVRDGLEKGKIPGRQTLGKYCNNTAKYGEDLS